MDKKKTGKNIGFITEEEIRILAKNKDNGWNNLDKHSQSILINLSDKINDIGINVSSRFPGTKWDYTTVRSLEVNKQKIGTVDKLFEGKILNFNFSERFNPGLLVGFDLSGQYPIVFLLSVFDNNKDQKKLRFGLDKIQRILLEYRNMNPIEEIEKKSLNEIVLIINNYIQGFIDILNKEEKKGDLVGNEGTDHDSLVSKNVQFHPGILAKNELDLLNIEKDAKAIAQLICLKDLKQELAIGLFGHWGSGKTFFMDMIESSIQSLIDERYYYNNVHCIKFNAWHYSDGNILASLVNEIFISLIERIDGKNNQRKLEKSYADKLQLYKEAKNNLGNKTDSILKQKKEIESQIAEIKKKRNKIKPSLKTLQEFANQSLKNNPDIKKEIDLLPEKFKNQLPKDITPQEIEHLDKYLNSGFLLFNNFRTFWKNSNVIFRTIFGILIIFSIIIFLSWMIPSNENFIFEKVITYLKSIPKWFAPAIALVGSLLPYVKGASKVMMNLANAKKQFENEINRIKEIDLEEEKSLIEERSLIDIELQKLENEKREIDRKQAYYTDKLKNHNLNEEIASFIRERSNSSDYKAHLGVVSMVKKDFEMLKDLLLEIQLDEDHQSENPKIKKIVLFIDDLDRCKDDIVLEVLEIVHLILALDLFAVVVGVDARWVSGALKKRYGHKLDDTKGHASPYDYLEKIFQIPYVLSPMTNSSKEVYIDGLLENISRNEEISEKQNNIKLNEEQKDDGNGNTEDERITKNKSSSNDSSTMKPIEPEEKNIEIVLQVPSIEEKEREFLKLLAPLLSDTPRTIKRYINTYLIFKAKENIRADEDEDYKVIMFLLALVICQSQEKTTNYLLRYITDKYNSDSTISNKFSELLIEFYEEGFPDQEKEKVTWELINQNAYSSLLLFKFFDEINLSIPSKEEDVQEGVETGIEKLFGKTTFDSSLGDIISKAKQFSFRSLEV